MDFSALRQEAIDATRAKLRDPLQPDQILVHAWRCTIDRPKALENWLFSVLPDLHPNEAREKVNDLGADAWNPDGRGASMGDEGWKALRYVCRGRVVNVNKLAELSGKNLHALLGFDTMAEMVDAAGSMNALARMTQRDAMRLGNESGTFGGKPKKSILERHELATNERSLRVLASRAVLAARLDVFKGQFKGEALRQEVLYAQ